MLKRFDEAEDTFRSVQLIDPENVDSHIGLCRTYLKRRQNMLASGEAIIAVGLQYDLPIAHYLLGVALHRMGRLVRAVEALNVALKQNPNFSAALDRLAYIYENRFNDLEKSNEYRARSETVRKQAKAFRSGELIPESLPPRKGIIASDEETISVHSDAVPEMAGTLDDTVVLVSGMPRSGTSMMMQMLAAGGLAVLTDEKRMADDDNIRGYFEYEPVRVLNRQIEWMPEAKGKTLKVIAPLLTRLPKPEGFRYRIIFMERDLREVIASQRTMINRLGTTGSRQTDDKLEETYNKQLRQMQKFVAAAGIPVLYVLHRECIENPAEQVRRINCFLGGNLDEVEMSAVVSDDLYRHRK